MVTFVHTSRKSRSNVLMSSPVGGDDMDRGTPSAASSARRTRFLLSGVVVLAVLGGVSFYLTSNVFSSQPAAGRAAASPTAAATGCDAASCAGTPAGMAIAAPPKVVRVPPRPTGT